MRVSLPLLGFTLELAAEPVVKPLLGSISFFRYIGDSPPQKVFSSSKLLDSVHLPTSSSIFFIDFINGPFDKYEITYSSRDLYSLLFPAYELMIVLMDGSSILLLRILFIIGIIVLSNSFTTVLIFMGFGHLGQLHVFVKGL